MVFGIVWALVGYAATRGQRDFSSVRVVVATRYEVLVEHKLLAQAQELLAQLPGAVARTRSPEPQSPDSTYRSDGKRRGVTDRLIRTSGR